MFTSDENITHNFVIYQQCQDITQQVPTPHFYHYLQVTIQICNRDKVDAYLGFH